MGQPPPTGDPLGPPRAPAPPVSSARRRHRRATVPRSAVTAPTASSTPQPLRGDRGAGWPPRIRGAHTLTELAPPLARDRHGHRPLRGAPSTARSCALHRHQARRLAQPPPSLAEPQLAHPTRTPLHGRPPTGSDDSTQPTPLPTAADRQPTTPPAADDQHTTPPTATTTVTHNAPNNRHAPRTQTPPPDKVQHHHRETPHSDAGVTGPPAEVGGG